MDDTDKQEKLVGWAYAMQWSTLIMPPAIVASLVYLLVVRGRITHADIRSHVRWQLTTCAVIAALIPIALGLLFVGFSGVNTDALISIVATFVLVGGSCLFLPWFLYRLLHGTIRFSRQLPMQTLLP